MISIVLVAALIGLALLTQAGVWLLQRSYPQRGEAIAVDVARLNVVDLGPRHSFDPPIVLIHGASSNLEVMRHPLGELLARRYRVILIDRPGHGWSARLSAGLALSLSLPRLLGRDGSGGSFPVSTPRSSAASSGCGKAMSSC